MHVRQGKGTFVGAPVLRQPLDRFTGLHEVLVAHGVSAHRRLIAFRPATADECARTLFESDRAGRPTLLQRLYSLHGKPFAVVHGLIGPSLAGMTRHEAARQTIHERLAAHAGGIADAELTIRARPVPRDIGSLLGLSRRRAVLVMERTSRAHDGVVLDHSLFFIVPEAWEFRLTVAGPA